MTYCQSKRKNKDKAVSSKIIPSIIQSQVKMKSFVLYYKKKIRLQVCEVSPRWSAVKSPVDKNWRREKRDAENSGEKENKK